MLWHDPSEHATYSQVVELDLGDVEPSIAGPRRPQDRVPLARAKRAFIDTLGTFGVDYSDGDEAVADTFPASDPTTEQQPGGEAMVESPPVATAPAPDHNVTAVAGADYDLDHGSVVIAAITSCTNTSNPQVMVAAGLLARNALELGLQRKPWVKSSLAPGSKVVTRYYEQAGLQEPLDALGFNTVGYGCTTCIGNSGPLADEISAAITEGDLVVCSVLSGNRNFEARIHPEVKANYLASPPLVVAYSLAGRMDIDFETEPIGVSKRVATSTCATSGRARGRSARRSRPPCARSSSRRRTQTSSPATTSGARCRFPKASSSRGSRTRPTCATRRTSRGCRASPASSATSTAPAASCGSATRSRPTTSRPRARSSRTRRRASTSSTTVSSASDFNSYGARRGNHEVMVRGTFANVRLRNKLVPESEGTWTVHVPSGEEMTIYDASKRYLSEGTPLVVLAGKEYGSGSSRDWAAKGPSLLGVKAAIAESYERIHRSNLLMMGVLPLQFMDGESPESLGLTGRESFSISGVDNADASEVTVRADDKEFRARLRLDTPREREYLRHGGILQYVLRRLLA